MWNYKLYGDYYMLVIIQGLVFWNCGMKTVNSSGQIFRTVKKIIF